MPKKDHTQKELINMIASDDLNIEKKVHFLVIKWIDVWKLDQS